MLELYIAYADQDNLIELLESLLKSLADALNGSGELVYQGDEIHLGKPFARITVEEAVKE